MAPPPVLETETTGLADHAPVPAATEEVSKRKRPHLAPPPIQLGAEQLREYLPLLKDKAVGLVVNHTSMVGPTHLADTLLALGIRVEKIFAPEHGFRGAADAGETISDGRDTKTGVSLVSLYGNKKEPSAEDLASLDVLIFDIQDVGTRFYTYISTLHYVMKAAAKHNKHLIVLDRPNPNGHYVDGPILDTAYRSFVGMHPIPIVHGMTVGEYARMINGEGWLGDTLQCELTVVTCKHYEHSRPYELPLAPSPNLPNNLAIYLYPSLCFFEGTQVSVGRGTYKQFQVYGHPLYPIGNFLFTPQPLPGAKQPPQEGFECRGFDLSILSPDSLHQAARIDLNYIIDFYHQFPDTDAFFLRNRYFDRLAGGPALREQIAAGLPADSIRATWQEGLNAFKAQRKPYLLYKE